MKKSLKIETYLRKKQEKYTKIIGLAAIKYGDLSNQATKDYVFDIDRFTSFEGNTGPYILYTIVRIKSILKKYAEQGNELSANGKIVDFGSESERSLKLVLTQFNDVMEASCIMNWHHTEYVLIFMKLQMRSTDFIMKIIL